MRHPAFTLLLVDDEPADVALFTDACREIAPDLRVMHAVHGQAALELLEQGLRSAPLQLPELILLDLNMPVMSGHEFLEQIKRDPLLRPIPVVVLSTSEAMDDIRRSFRNYAGGYLVKPGNVAELHRMIEAVIAYWDETVALPPLS